MPCDQPGRCALVLTAGQTRAPRGLSRRTATLDRTLLERTLERVRRSIPSERTLVVAAHSEQRDLSSVLQRVPGGCVLLEPEDRGSTPAILYGMLRLAMIDFAAPVGIFTEDPHVADDAAFTIHLDDAFDVIRARPDLVVLLGAAPQRRGDDVVWIEAGEPIPGAWNGQLSRVRRIWDRPPAAMVTQLETQGALCSAPVIVGHPFAVTTLIKRTLPELAGQFLRIQPWLATPWESTSVRRLYSRLSSTDFCRRVLAARPANLAVLTPVQVPVRTGAVLSIGDRSVASRLLS